MGSAGQRHGRVRVHSRPKQAIASIQQLPLRTVALATEPGKGFMNCCSGPVRIASGQRSVQRGLAPQWRPRRTTRLWGARVGSPRGNVRLGRPVSGASGLLNRLPAPPVWLSRGGARSSRRLLAQIAACRASQWRGTISPKFLRVNLPMVAGLSSSSRPCVLFQGDWRRSRVPVPDRKVSRTYGSEPSHESEPRHDIH